MKNEKIIALLFLLILFVALGTFVLYQQQEAMMNGKIAALKNEAGELKAAFQGFDAKAREIDALSKDHADTVLRLKGLEEKVGAADVEREDFGAKIGALMQDVEDLKSKVAAAKAPAVVSAAPAAAKNLTQEKPVDAAAVNLGEIPVAK